LEVALPEVALQLLQAELQRLPDRIRDEKFARALLRPCGQPLVEGRGSGRVELEARREPRQRPRRGHARPELPRYRIGCEGTLDRTVLDELTRLGWSVERLDTSSHDPAHVGDYPSPPPQAGGRG
jgi:hypothetical protein